MFYTLGGLSSEYEPLTMSITSRIVPVMLEELQTLFFFTWEHRMVLSTQMVPLDISSTQPAANIATRQPEGGHGCGRDWGM